MVEIEMATHFPGNDCDGEDTDAENNAGALFNDARSCKAYDVHHRMHVNLSENLAATDSKNDWTLSRFDYKKWRVDDDGDDDGTGSTHDGLKQSPCEWQSAITKGEKGGENVQAFEEKFDCFLIVRGCHIMNTGNDAEPEQHNVDISMRKEEGKCCINGEQINMVRTERHQYTGSWYGAESAGRLCGVALIKEFDPTFSFSLVEYGNKMAGIRSSARVVGKASLIVQ